MERDQYLKERVDDQINWYDLRSKAAQLAFRRLRHAEIVCAALVPFMAGFAGSYASVAFLVGLLGAVVVVLAAFQSLGQYQENWIDYRSICESLKHEKYLFLTGADPYTAPEAFPLLVQRVENLLSKENRNWSQDTRTGTTQSLPAADKT
ncbi:conserved hypothetical protein [Desulfosarcina cetonica]|uniref:DUF4231 domain-containing protein n=1 Tax=Desulfosarcina cetonica TaxID=90730 RepID=UPI0006D27B12|nr:DUF4231 domain-containing protein [Desulfosarcina cetonica]VTR66977.1 conserved hypothetical protein [Desulfosarcina cetonica]